MSPLNAPKALKKNNTLLPKPIVFCIFNSKQIYNECINCDKLFIQLLSNFTLQSYHSLNQLIGYFLVDGIKR